MSKDSLRRVTLGWGKAVEMRRREVAEQVFGIEGESPADPCPAEVRVWGPIRGAANISTDGGMILVRGEGWKEAKLSTLSEVEPRPKQLTLERQVVLQGHSYQAGLWDADQMGQHQYLEGLRRDLANCTRLSSVNDGAPWIDRITAVNYPHAQQIIDWSHADERIWKVAKAAFGEGTAQTRQWAQDCLDHLWEGRPEVVVHALRSLDWEMLRARGADTDCLNSPAYFQARVSKMDYARFREAGYPIGSGTVESGINVVIHHRMKRQGRGWIRANGQFMLAALGELHSHRFEDTWHALLHSPN